MVPPPFPLEDFPFRMLVSGVQRWGCILHISGAVLILVPCSCTPSISVLCFDSCCALIVPASHSKEDSSLSFAALGRDGDSLFLPSDVAIYKWLCNYREKQRFINDIILCCYVFGLLDFKKFCCFYQKSVYWIGMSVGFLCVQRMRGSES